MEKCKKCGYVEPEMTRKEAVTYLKKKGRIRTEKKITAKEVKKENEKEIAEVMREGKIYGDPVANIRWK